MAKGKKGKKRKKDRQQQPGKRGSAKRAGPSRTSLIIMPQMLRDQMGLSGSASRLPLGKKPRGGKKMAKKSGLARLVGKKLETYSSVAGNVGVQIGCEVGEAAAALLSMAVDTVVKNTETKADDLAMPWVKKAASTGARWVAGNMVAKRHPGLAAVMSAAASSASGCEYKSYFQRHAVVATRNAAESLQQGNPGK